MNRYTLFAFVMILVILVMTMFEGTENGSSIIGYADDIHQSENGYTFTINDANDNNIRAFSRTEVDDSIHTFKGNYSQDGGMFFVDEID